MAKRGPKPKTRLCLVCNAPMIRRINEPQVKWDARRTCSNRCKYIRLSQQRKGYHDRIEAPVKPEESWPAGIRFGRLDLPEDIGRLTIPRPVTHRTYGTSAS